MAKKNTLVASILLFALNLLLSSCSHEEKIVASEKIYSRSTQKSFEDIENSEVQNKIVSSSYTNKIHSTPSSINPKTKETTNPSNVELTVSRPINAKSQERLIEINQNLAFYCMKHRNNSSFTSLANCQKFTKSVLNTCEKKHKLINTVMLNCIKDRLRKRK